jgi:hypothetical protein
VIVLCEPCIFFRILWMIIAGPRENCMSSANREGWRADGSAVALVLIDLRVRSEETAYFLHGK